MVLLRKKSAGNAPGYSWDADGAVVDVDDALAQELLERPGDEFVEVPEEKPEPESTEVTEPEPEADDEPAATEDDSPKKTTRRRTKVNE